MSNPSAFLAALPPSTVESSSGVSPRGLASPKSNKKRVKSGSAGEAVTASGMASERDGNFDDDDEDFVLID